ncbi:hypothetical protein C5167_030690 [Papaver somniferum]|nr:hypothetical protein C5167_030690 [Papaver somniferum]
MGGMKFCYRLSLMHYGFYFEKVYADTIEALRISYKKMNPFCVPFAIISKGWMGPNYSISTSCATGNFCILNAANHIIRGEAVVGCVMLRGGSDSVIIPSGYNSDGYYYMPCKDCVKKMQKLH